ncbi:Manganese-transporting ATPase 13A1 [Blattella germanica]|nr:Manganese-transporting ATPase 13A1 [Blattella germanica]
MVGETRIDDLVQSVSLHVPRQFLFHGYILPFLILYATWLYGWVFVYGAEDYYEAGLIGIAVIGLLQILSCLCCHWSVHVQCFLTCKNEKDPLKAKVAKVVPTANNGSSELVSVHHFKDDVNNGVNIWFIFQKTKYVWDENKKQFCGLQFPVDLPFGEYMEWKGYQEDNEVTNADIKYGRNQLDMVVPEFMELFKERATAPFFVFQVLCVALWCLDKYWYYSLFTLVMLILFECTLVQQQLRNMAEIRKMGNKPYMMQVYRSRRWRPVLTDQLVPGDIVSIARSQHDNYVPCDLLLLRGPCIVDESMLTGSEDPNRNRYKLFLECALILTSVVPPELPIELSLAVNTSLLSLSKLDIPVFSSGQQGVVPLAETSLESIQVLATCHALAQLDDGLVGDPLEKATLTAVDWNLTKGDAVIPKRGKAPGMKIFHRHHFSSALKRMSVIAGYTLPGSTDTTYITTVKGAPETLKSMFSSIPSTYDSIYLEMSRRGARVLALGWKELGRLTPQQTRELTRDELECDLKFAGFVIISCPLKTDSKSVIKEILNASHLVVMITGDNPLTACHVAKELRFTHKPKTLILTEVERDGWAWESIDQTQRLPILPQKGYKELVSKYDLCVTGEGLTFLSEQHKQFLYQILPHISVFARVAPKQKEFVIVTLKALGYTTLMCGDGTNDVGALKHADVGVAILSNAPERMPERKKPERGERERERERERNRGHGPGGANPGPHGNPRQNAANATHTQLQKLLKEIEEQDQAQIVKLGDASIAAPFTSKLSSIMCICHVIKQGRCTLVTTLQMFKILALNALILAYSQSVLYLDGIKFSDMQATLQGLLLAACFLFISRSKQATMRSPPKEEKVANPEEEEEEFVPSLLNSTVYIISMALQVSTFAINYRGHPYMESLTENKALLYSIVGSAGAILVLAMGIFPDMAYQFEIVDFPAEFRFILVQVLFADFALSFLVDRVCLWLLGEGKLRIK